MLATAAPARAYDGRVEARASGSDRPTALRIADALLRRRYPLQLTRVRCEAVRTLRACGLVLEGTHLAPGTGEIAVLNEASALIRGAFAAAPEVGEVDLWATVPIDAGHGAVVSGDLAVPTARNVFTVTVARERLAGLEGQLRGPGVFWDPAFRASLAKGRRS